MHSSCPSDFITRETRPSFIDFPGADPLRMHDFTACIIFRFSLPNQRLFRVFSFPLTRNHSTIKSYQFCIHLYETYKHQSLSISARFGLENKFTKNCSQQANPTFYGAFNYISEAISHCIVSGGHRQGIQFHEKLSLLLTQHLALIRALRFEFIVESCLHKTDEC